MPEPISPIAVTPTGDDQPWKRDLERIVTELIARQVADRSEIEYLKGRVQ